MLARALQAHHTTEIILKLSIMRLSPAFSRKQSGIHVPTPPPPLPQTGCLLSNVCFSAVGKGEGCEGERHRIGHEARQHRQHCFSAFCGESGRKSNAATGLHRAAKGCLQPAPTLSFFSNFRQNHTPKTNPWTCQCPQEAVALLQRQLHRFPSTE